MQPLPNIASSYFTTLATFKIPSFECCQCAGVLQSQKCKPMNIYNVYMYELHHSGGESSYIIDWCRVSCMGGRLTVLTVLFTGATSLWH
jgi:hypothetical protein